MRRSGASTLGRDRAQEPETARGEKQRPFIVRALSPPGRYQHLQVAELTRRPFVRRADLPLNDQQFPVRSDYATTVPQYGDRSVVRFIHEHVLQYIRVAAAWNGLENIPRHNLAAIGHPGGPQHRVGAGHDVRLVK